MVADKSGWARKKRGKGHGFGFAAHRSFLTYVATVVEVEVSDDGEIPIPRVDTAVDAGFVVNPEITRVQFEGAAVFGTSIVRNGEITAKNGAIQQSNFNDYPVARINEVPAQTNVYKLDAACRRGRARSTAVRCRVLQCDFRGHGKAGPRSAALEQQLVCIGATAQEILPCLLTIVTRNDHASVVPINRRCKREGLRIRIHP